LWIKSPNWTAGFFSENLEIFYTKRWSPQGTHEPNSHAIIELLIKSREFIVHRHKNKFSPHSIFLFFSQASHSVLLILSFMSLCPTFNFHLNLIAPNLISIIQSLMILWGQQRVLESMKTFSCLLHRLLIFETFSCQTNFLLDVRLCGNFHFLFFILLVYRNCSQLFIIWSECSRLLSYFKCDFFLLFSPTFELQISFQTSFTIGVCT
jgi:hypothetical protein